MIYTLAIIVYFYVGQNIFGSGVATIKQNKIGHGVLCLYLEHGVVERERNAFVDGYAQTLKYF
jgi:uncharacterized membrane protein YGL010W